MENRRANLAVRGRTTKRPRAQADKDAPAHKHDGKSSFEQTHRGVRRGIVITKQRGDADGNQGESGADENVNLQNDNPFDLGIPDGSASNTTAFEVSQCI